MNRIAGNTAGLSRLVWSAGITVGASLPHWSTQPVWIPVLLLACVGWRFAARLLRWRLPGIWTIGTITLGAFVAVILDYGTINGLRPGTALLVVMVALKFLEAKSQRDHIILTVIAYFLVFAGVLAGGGVVKAIYLMAFVWITTVGLMQVGRVGPLLPNGPTARQAGKLLLQAIPLMLVLFLLFPRLSGPLWSLPADDQAAVSGLSGSMSPGDITNLGLSDAIAFRVEFDGPEPAPQDLYWRGPVLTRFDGRSWSQRNQMGSPAADPERTDPLESLDFDGGSATYRVALETTGRNWAFALDLPAQWSPARSGFNLFMQDAYQLVYFARGEVARGVTYDVTSYTDYRAREALAPEDIDAYLNLPPERNPRTRALIDSWLAESADPEFIIARAFELFGEDDFYYTLTPPALGLHSVDEFIFETREGFCEHYASAFAVMLRMAGIPARVVTGYQGGERNGFGDYYIIRQSDAHAWTEIWSATDGWRRVDPVTAVAPQRIAFGSTGSGLRQSSGMVQRLGQMTLLRQLALSWDAVNTLWKNWVIDYGPRLQRQLLEWLGFEQPERRDLMLLSVIALIGGMAALGYSLSWRHGRPRQRDPALASFRRFVRRLGRTGAGPIRVGETPTAFAERAADCLPAAAASIRRIARAYLAARYEPDHDGAALARLQQLVRRFSPRGAPGSP